MNINLDKKNPKIEGAVGTSPKTFLRGESFHVPGFQREIDGTTILFIPNKQLKQ